MRKVKKNDLQKLMGMHAWTRHEHPTPFITRALVFFFILSSAISFCFFLFESFVRQFFLVTSPFPVRNCKIEVQVFEPQKFRF